MNKKKNELQNTLDKLKEMIEAIFSEICTLKKVKVGVKKRLDMETKGLCNELYILNIFQAE